MQPLAVISSRDSEEDWLFNGRFVLSRLRAFLKADRRLHQYIQHRQDSEVGA